MIRYLLDTDALIDFSKAREPAFSKINEWAESNVAVAVCSVCVAEFYAGLSSEEAATWRKFISSLLYWDINRQVAMQAGQYRYHFARQGRVVTIADALIAAVASEKNAALVTGNVKDYPMTDITLVPLSTSNE